MSESMEIPETRSLTETFRRLVPYLRKNRGTYFLGVGVTLAYIACFIVVPLLVGWAIDGFVAEDRSSSDILQRCAWIFGVTILQGVLRFYSRTLIFNAAREVEYELRNELFSQFQRLPQSFFFRWRTGDLMSRCVNDLHSIRLLLGPGVLNLLSTPVLFLGVSIAMLGLSPKLTLLSALPYPLFILIARKYGAGMHRWSLLAQEGLSNLSSFLQERIAGIAVNKAYAMEEASFEQFEKWNRELYQRQLGAVRYQAALPIVAGLLPGLAMLIVFWIGGMDVATGRIPLSTFFTFAMYVYALTFPTFILGWVMSLIQRGAAAMQRIEEVLSEEPSIADRPDAVEMPEIRGEIEFRNFSFRYPGSERSPALKNISVHVPAGSTLGVVGPVGAGKSTLASVIPRLYEVEDGALFLDGVEINRIPLKTLRSSIAMVPQDAFLFSMTLGQNIAYGLSEMNEERVREASDRAQLTKDIQELPHGFNTIVGERGVMLSGGQRQRAALARALALDPRILILDDTLSAVDAETEVAIQEGLQEVLRDRTVVMISSRVHSVQKADHILVLDEGEVVEQGTHESLLQEGGLYFRLAREQELEDALGKVEA